MWLNAGMFQQNGRSGYILKPEFLRTQCGFDPYNVSSLNQDQLILTIKVISARHLIKPSRGIASPLVELEIVGVEADCCKYKTRTVADNGLCPVWNEEVTFTMSVPELASLRIMVQDEDMFGDSNTIGQACFPLGGKDTLAIRTGFRSVQLKNTSNEPLELSSLLLHVEATFQPKNDEYQSMQDLRAQARREQQHRDKIVTSLATAGRTDAAKDEELKQSKLKILELEQKMLAKKTSTLPAKARTARK